MKVGIDSYCYHRFFGEVYPEQVKPPDRMTLQDFLKRAHQLGVDGVSLESCFIPVEDRGFLSEIRAMLDEYGLDRVWAWGHPDGLEGGKNRKEFDAMLANLEYAGAVGAKVMRVVGSSLQFRFEPHGPQIERLSRMFSEAVKQAEKQGIRMAVENHIDFNADEMLAILKNVSSPYLGLNFDSGNFVRVLDDPVKAMEKLARYVYATHIKDVSPMKGGSPKDWHYWESVPAGKGIVNIPDVMKVLRRHKYNGVLAVELDCLREVWEEDQAVEMSVNYLREQDAKLDS